ncbi:MAG: alpha-2-macroglobulin [Lactobacillaceae bacterium]|nr:alpha-2-macroglobulin [Lactobacillaceae bacterium]
MGKKSSKEKTKSGFFAKIKTFFKNKKILWTLLVIGVLVMISAGIGIYLYLNRGYLISKKAEKTTAYATIYEPENSYISYSNVSPGSLRIYYGEPVAKGELVSSEVTSGVSIHPDIRGKWYFSGDKNLYFTPEKDWIPNTKYTVKLDGSIFSPEVIVKDKDFTFNSPTFSAYTDSSDFYEDPTDTKKKQAVATFSFNYPIDAADLEKNVSVKTIGGDKYGFTVKRDDNDINKIHVMSDPVKIKAEEDFVEIKVFGVRNAYNNEKIAKEAAAKIKIPSSSTFFKITSVSTNIVNNENNNNEPEQILFMNFSTAVDNAELLDYTDFYYKDDSCYNFRDRLTKVSSPLEISGVKKLEVQKLNDDSGKTHLFKYDIESRNACVVVKIKKGLGSKDGFILANDEVLNFSAANYPMEAKIAFEGSILSLKGDKKLALSSRASDRLDIQVARISSKDINHLVSQTAGDFSHPYFRGYTFDETNISEIFDVKQNINMEHPAKLNYSSVDLNQYFKEKKGIFLIRVNGSYQNSAYTSEDRRLVVITDMGIITKDNLDKTHDVFVSSFSNGYPVPGAKVEVLGKNGIAVLEGYTNGQGMVTFPDFTDFRKDKEPVAYLITNGGDISYMPIDKYDRRLDYSRFEVDGIYESREDNKVVGYAFSDRGIYRPGEEARFGIMVRSSDLTVPNKLPMKLTIRNPNGDEVASKQLWANEVGYLDFRYNIAGNAPVGTYTLSLYDESKSYSTYITSAYFKVEEFTPDNMKIKLKLENIKSKGWYKLPELKAEIDLQNLYGNPAGGNNIKADLSLVPTSFWFKEFQGYSFRDPLRDISNSYIRSHHEELDTIQTNERGRANYSINLNQFDRGTYTLRLAVTGYELDSGRGVSASSSALVSPLDYIVGYKADGGLSGIKKNAERGVSFVVIDNELNRLEKNDLFLEQIAIKYVSSLMQMPNGTYRYQMVSKEETVKSEAFPISEAGSNLALDTSAPGSFYYLVKDSEGGVLSRVDYSVEGAENTNFALDKDANLSVALDKKEYNHGDEIKVNITAPYEGYGLITIERDKTYTYKWFKTDSNKTTETIRLPYTVEGNAYVNVAFIRGINSKEIFVPPLSYAVVPFGINKEARTVKIDLDVPEVVKPGKDLVVKYKASKPGKIIVYGVNQGILQVANYKTPDPLSEFMKKKALRVSTYQIMDLIMPEMNLVLNYKAAGGDEEISESDLQAQQNPFARKQNEVVAFWSGVIDATEEYQEFTYKVPEIFNGQIKVMAVAVSETSFGVSEKDAYVRGDFALIPSGPFNVIPGDVFEVGTSVANLVENSGDNYEIRVVLDVEDGLEVFGEKEQVVKLREKGETSIRFRVQAANKLGSSALRFTAEAVKDSSKSFSMPYHIGIRPATPYLTALTMGYEPSKLKLKDFVIPMFNEYRRQEVMASTSPLVLADGLVRFLDKFPHWCSEQTISKVYPAMVLLFKQPELVKDIDVYNLFDTAVATLNERQKLDGGFSGWSGSYSSANEYVSLYAYDFLSRAKEYNFNVPNGMLTKAANYAKSVAGRDMSGENDLDVAYAIYLLTRNGEVTTNYLLNAERYLEANYKKTWKNTLASTYMAASYKMLKNETKARALLGRYKLGKDNIEDARYIYLMAAYFNDDFKDLGQKAVQALLDPLKSGNFTTNSAAYSLLALTAYDLSADKDIVFVGKEPVYTPFAEVGVSSEDKVLEISSPKSFFYVVSEQGFGSNSVTKAKSSFIELSKQYFNKAGKAVVKANIGDEITVKLTVRTTGGRDYINDVAITDLIPGCFEIVRDSISSSGSLDNKEEREDRALIYLTADKSTREITYKVKVIAKGEFVSPAAFGEALYDSDVKANTVSSTFIVEE